MPDRPLPPRPSPRPAAEIDDVDPDAPITGLHPASRDFVREVNHSGLFRVAWWIGGAAVLLFGTGVLATRAVAQEARDAGREAASGHETRIGALEQQVPQLRTELHDARGELRELYHAVTEGKRSPALEKPLPPLPKDGGA